MISFVGAVWRSFQRNHRRFHVLLLSIFLVTFTVTVILGVVVGLHDTVRQKASRYFAGDLVVNGHTGDGLSRIEDVEIIEEAVNRLSDDGYSIEAISKRSTFFANSNIELYFSGFTARQRRLVGVEWDLEKPILSTFDFTVGGVPTVNDENAILISTTTAEQLGATVGDNITISVFARITGRINTGEYVISGIFAETSFFGFTAYLHRSALNRLKDLPDDTIDEIGVYLSRNVNERVAAERLTQYLMERGLSTYGPVFVRRDYNEVGHIPRDVRHYGVATLGAQLAEITDLLGAITIIAGGIMSLFLGLVVVGIGNTWTMVVWERTKEIGTMRAMGMQRIRTIAFFLLESAFLGFLGVVTGTVFGAIVLGVTHRFFYFAPNAFTTLFFSQGRLPWRLPIWGVGLIIFLAVVSSVLGAVRAAIRAGHVHPVEAMRQER